MGRCCIKSAHSLLQQPALLLHNVRLLLQHLLVNNQNTVDSLAALFLLFCFASFELRLSFCNSKLANCNFGLQFCNECAKLLQLPLIWVQRFC